MFISSIYYVFMYINKNPSETHWSSQCKCVNNYRYEGRSINKLQNSIILLVFRSLKFRNIHFVGDLILSTSYKFYYDDVTVTSLETLDMATLLLRSSHIEQRSVICLLWAKGLSTNAIQSEMRPVW